MKVVKNEIFGSPVVAGMCESAEKLISIAEEIDFSAFSHISKRFGCSGVVKENKKQK